MIRVYHNLGCANCARKAALTRSLDWFGLVEHSATTPAGKQPPIGQIAVQDMQTGEWHEGVDAVRQVCFHIPLYVPFGLLLLIPAVSRWFDRAMKNQSPAGRLAAEPPKP